MRIIKRGVKPELKLMRGICNNCGCEIECTVGELIGSRDQRDPESYIICPTCNNQIFPVKIVKHESYNDPLA